MIIARINAAEQPTEIAPKRTIRFRLSTVLIGMTLLAMALAAAKVWYEWLNAAEYYPLKGLVEQMNDEAQRDFVGQFEPPVTESEIRKAIHQQMSNLPAEVRNKFDRIARTKEVPTDTKLYFHHAFVDKHGTEYTVWWINLSIRTVGSNGYALRIRETNQPKAIVANQSRLPQGFKSTPSSP